MQEQTKRMTLEEEREARKLHVQVKKFVRGWQEAMMNVVDAAEGMVASAQASEVNFVRQVGGLKLERVKKQRGVAVIVSITVVPENDEEANRVVEKGVEVRDWKLVEATETEARGEGKAGKVERKK